MIIITIIIAIIRVYKNLITHLHNCNNQCNKYSKYKQPLILINDNLVALFTVQKFRGEKAMDKVRVRGWEEH